MEVNLQEAINKLPVIQKAHIYEPKIEDVIEIAFRAGYRAGVEDHHKTCLLDYEAGLKRGVDWLIIEKDYKDWQTFLKEKGIEQPE